MTIRSQLSQVGEWLLENDIVLEVSAFAIGLIAAKLTSASLLSTGIVAAISIHLLKVEFRRRRDLLALKKDLQAGLAARLEPVTSANLKYIPEIASSMAKAEDFFIYCRENEPQISLRILAEHYRSLLKWKSKVQERPQSLAWEILCEVYINQELQYFQRDSIFTTSEVYTGLLKRISSEWNRLVGPDAGGVCRFQLSGMLPEDFYNGPQIENRTDSSVPIVVRHKWEKYAMYDDREVHRCLLVRSSEAPKAMRALPTYDELKAQGSLLIHGRGRRTVRELQLPKRSSPKLVPAIRRLFPGEFERLHRQNLLSDLIDSIPGANSFTYHPIVEVGTNGIEETDYTSLLDAYIEDFNLGPHTARYLEVSDQSFSAAAVEEYFGDGLVPEIALFGIQAVTGGPPQDWLFGIQGLWRPYTRQMQLWFLDSERANALAQVFQEAIYGETRLVSDLTSKNERFSSS